jgi:polyhydroxyalkanoate synthesis regulator phasin
MSDDQIPATQPESGATPGEFDFAKPVTENPRIKRRSLKAKPGGLLTPVNGAPPAARELEHEAPPLSAEEAVKPQETEEIKIKPAVKIAEPAPAPPKVTPSPTATTSHPASATPAPRAAASPKIASTLGPTSSPHGTRPATLYYSSHPRKDKEATLPMKTIPTASPAPSTSATTLPSSMARSVTSSTRPTTSVDYRANVDRQAREQKSVGSLLAYVVYGLIAFFVVSALLAGYGTKVIFDRLHDQSATVSDLDARYGAANKDLTAKLATAQDTLNQAQAQIARQQDLIVKQQEEINRVITAMNDTTSAMKAEKQARTMETASLRARVKDLENKQRY